MIYLNDKNIYFCSSIYQGYLGIYVKSFVKNQTWVERKYVVGFVLLFWKIAQKNS